MAEMGIADYFARAADWLAQARLRRRIEYERASHARPDYGKSPSGAKWFRFSDAILMLAGTAFRSVALLGYGIGALLLLFWIWVALNLLGIVK